MAISMLNQILKNKRGDGLILTMLLVFVVLSLICVVGQYMQMYLFQQKIEYELQRAVNCAVEYAMGDSYRQDKIGYLNVQTAKQEFEKYIREDMGLDSLNRKYQSGKFAYSLQFQLINGTAQPPEFTVIGTAKSKAMFPFLIGEIVIPFRIKSTNFRTD